MSSCDVVKRKQNAISLKTELDQFGHNDSMSCLKFHLSHLFLEHSTT